MDPLSAVANVAAVIGLLDSICRIGKETYKLISAVKHAPEEIQRLKLELEEIEFILVNMNRYCHQYQQQHASLVEESFSAVARVYRTLRSLETEYNSINKIIADLGLSQRGKRERLRGLKSKFQLVLGGKLEASFVTLQNYKMQLSSSLQFLAG
jgi:SUMO ligase MMS21 Smc5/6 complex component